VSARNHVVIETGKQTKVFASAIDWPGWSRSGKTEADALETLAAYGERYRVVAGRVGDTELPASAAAFTIIEHTPGNGATDFGVPGVPATCEDESMTADECERQIRLLQACWATFDEVASRVSAELRKGPRGGGRDRDKIVEHVLEAERGYVRDIDVRTPPGAMDTADGLREHREAVCQAIREFNAAVGRGRKWPVRYLIRRAAWHVMDHAWEMEDKDLS
jgi:hypothetical protein